MFNTLIYCLLVGKASPGANISIHFNIDRAEGKIAILLDLFLFCYLVSVCDIIACSVSVSCL